MASIEKSSSKEYFIQVVTTYESKASKLHEKQTAVQQIDQRIQNLDLLKKASANTEKKKLEQEIRLLTDDLDKMKPEYHAAKNSINGSN